MIRKRPSNFGSHDDWLAHVRREIPILEQPYALAVGRMELFRRFYRMQELSFPTQFTEELQRIETMHDPERTPALEALNDLIFRSLTMHLFNRARSITSIDDRKAPASPRKEIEELFSHVAKKNRYFALWTVYKRGVSDRSVAEEWDEYLLQELGTQSPEAIVFTRAMVELDRLLTLFHDENLALPSLAFERIWFLHYLRGPERMAQTRAVLGMLMAELEACTSA
ncbi:MAG TPA: hypothetical protein VK574_02505 [Terracidiphilus sp.]|nr:hypothetical protein [Terracidiphilus sp.]